MLNDDHWVIANWAEWKQTFHILLRILFYSIYFGALTKLGLLQEQTFEVSRLPLVQLGQLGL